MVDVCGSILIGIGTIVFLVCSFVLIYWTTASTGGQSSGVSDYTNDCSAEYTDDAAPQCTVLPLMIPFSLSIVLLGVMVSTVGTGAVRSGCRGVCRMVCGLPLGCLPGRIGVACGFPSVPAVGMTLPALDLTEACFKILLLSLTVMTGLLLYTFGDDIKSSLITVLSLVLNVILAAIAALGQLTTGSVVGLLTPTTHLFLQQLSQLVINIVVNNVAESLRHILEKYNELDLKIELEAFECKEKEGAYYTYKDDNEEFVKNEEKSPKKKGQMIYIATPTIKLGTDNDHSLELLKKSDHEPGALALAGADFSSRVRMEATVTIKLSGEKKGPLGKVFSCFSACFFSFGLPEGISISPPQVVITASTDDSSCTTDWKNACCPSKNTESDVDMEANLENQSRNTGFLTEGMTPMRCCNKKEASEAFQKSVENGLNETVKDFQDQVVDTTAGNIQANVINPVV